MNRKRFFVVGALVLAVAGGAAFALSSKAPAENAAVAPDPRSLPALVKVAEAKPAEGSQRAFTGAIAARVESNLGFRVPGKITDRLVDIGQQVKAGQPLMRIDETDLRLAVTAKENAVAAAQAVLVQASADEKRYATLVKNDQAATPQRYEQAKATLDTAQAQLDAAKADAEVAENAATYSVLVADTDGTVTETLAEPGQVVAEGQVVIRLAHAGPREAVVALPETIRPAVGSVASASLYGHGEVSSPARLRQISDSADSATRTYEARYVLQGDAAAAPLGATVTIRISNPETQNDTSVPLAALIDSGTQTGVWLIDKDSSTVHFRAVKVKRLGEETAAVAGLQDGDPVVALGVHLLNDGDKVRPSVDTAEAAQ